MIKNRSGGFSLILIPVAVVVLVLLATFVFVQVRQHQQDQQLPTGSKSKRQSQVADCSNFKFTRDTIKFSQIEAVTPPGSIIGGSLKAHSYINFKPDRVSIIAPTGMTLISAAKYTQPPDNNKVQYLLDFEADCGYTVRYDHISNPNSEITKQLTGPADNTSQTQSLKPIDYPAGSVVGSTDGNGVQHQFDFGVYKKGVTNAFVGDKRYEPYIESEVHTSAVCPYNLYAAAKSKQYYKLFSATKDHPQPDIICNKY